MPSLRFSRDKRGYETTLLVHSFRSRGKTGQRILYWFRTPPDVKVGRAALDEEAIRWIEEHNPEVTFDWAKILESKAPAATPPDDSRSRRGRRTRPERPQQTARQEPVDALPPAPAIAEETEPEEAAAADVIAEHVQEAAEALAQPQPSDPAPEPVLGPELLMKLRARFAELQARITERGGDPERIAALRLQADALNPVTWVTAEDTRQGLAEFEERFGQIRLALGLRKRRRSRRGGRRRRRPEQGTQQATLATLPGGPLVPEAGQPISEDLAPEDADEADESDSSDGE